MNIFLIGKHQNATTDSVAANEAQFADFSAVGTWVNDGSRCEVCGWHGQSLREPLLVQWDAGSDVVGDFSWDGPFGYVNLVRENVSRFFQEYNYSCSLHSVEYVASERPCSSPCIGHPYTGPKQFWAKCTAFVDLDLDASKVGIKLSCDECGRVKYTFRNQGIVIPRQNWNGEKMFRITTNGPSFATFVTDEARREIERQSFSNITFSPAGEIMD